MYYQKVWIAGESQFPTNSSVINIYVQLSLQFPFALKNVHVSADTCLYNLNFGLLIIYDKCISLEKSDLESLRSGPNFYLRYV